MAHHEASTICEDSKDAIADHVLPLLHRTKEEWERAREEAGNALLDKALSPALSRHLNDAVTSLPPAQV